MKALNEGEYRDSMMRVDSPRPTFLEGLHECSRVLTSIAFSSRSGMPFTTSRFADPDRARILKRGLVFVTSLLAVLHLIQGWSPLRLSEDVVHLLQVAGSVADGTGYVYRGAPTYYPHGYPALIAAFDRAGLGVSWVLFGVNYVIAGFGLWAAYRIARGPFRLQGWLGMLAVALTMLSFVFVKHVPLPMSDVPFFGLSMLSIYFLSRATSFPDSRRWLPLLVGTAFAAFAVWFRTIGIALAPAILWAVLSDSSPLTRISRHRLSGVMLGIVGVVAIVAAVFLIANSQAKYLGELDTYLVWLSQGDLVWEFYKRIQTLGELFLNLPGSQLPSNLEALLAVAGALALILMGYGLWLRRRHFSVPDVYLVTYLGIVTLWPARDTRFLLPVFPLLVLWGIVAVRQVIASPASRGWTVMVSAYLLGFGFAGTAALAYSTSLTFAGDSFPARYGKGAFESEYRIAFDGPSPGATSNFIPAIEVLVRYEPRTNVYFRDSPSYPRLSSELKEALSHSADAP